MALDCARRGLDWILGKILPQKACQALEQAAWGSDKSPSLDIFKRRVRCGAQRNRLGDLVVLGLAVGVNDLKGFLPPEQFYDSVIFYKFVWVQKNPL